MIARELRFPSGPGGPEVGAILLRPAAARWLLLLAHGAGAGMRHPFLASLADRLAAREIATFRYQFPYMETGTSRPDPPPKLAATVRSAVNAAGEAAPDLPRIAGGKSLGGRMTSTAAAQAPLEGVRGLVFFGFPLHPAGKPGTGRADHLQDVDAPMLFLQGTRDALADLTLLRPVLDRLGSRATLRVVEGADHSFHVLRSSGRRDDQVLEELADSVSAWASGLKKDPFFA